MLISSIVLSIVISIALGYKTKINIGFFGIIFAYLIGCFVMNLKPSSIVDLWPIRIFFIIMSVTLFYNFMVVNGTLEKLSNMLLYHTKNYPSLLPFSIFMCATFASALGAGFYAVLAFMAPLTLMLCDKTGLSRVIGAMAVNYGALAGSNFMTSQGGIIFRGLMEQVQVSSSDAFTNSSIIFIATLILPICILALLLLYGKLRGVKIKLHQINKPEPLNKIQRQTLFLVFLLIFIILMLPVLHIIFKDNEVISFINSKVDIGFLAIIFSIIALILKLGDERRVIALVPWSTLIMICGIGLLIAIALKAGVISLLASYISYSVSFHAIPAIVCVVACIMSIFSSTLGVVTPALFPIVPLIASSSGHSEAFLFTCIVVGAQSSAISPFSSGGSLVLSSAADVDRSKLFNDLLFVGVPLGFTAGFICILFMQIFI